MQYSDSSNYTGIVEEIDFLLDTDSTSYPVKQKTRNVNRWYDRAVSLILQTDAMWEWDDLNQTDLPIATTSLVASQQDYSISTAGFLRILRVECKDSAGNWDILHQIDQKQKKDIAMSEYRETAGTPKEFDIIANTLMLYPKPNYASSGGLKVYYQRVPDYFVYTDTTQEPGFAKPFHRLLSYGAALDFAVAKNMSGRIATLKDEIARLENGLIEHYSNRNRDVKVGMSLQKEDYSGDAGDPESVGWVS